MIQVNALGDTCPIPVVKTKAAIRQLEGAGALEILVDNEIAVQNLTKMAKQKGYGVADHQLEENVYQVIMTIGEGANTNTEDVALPETCALPTSSVQKVVVAISSNCMGTGDDTLGANLLKAFLYALSKQEDLPQTILFYNGGARMTCLDSPAIEDLKAMEEEGVEILTCGTCLNFYGLTDQLKVGGITNMYDIVDKMTHADRIVKP